jgi:nucleotidyltransferase/DNA polymerase involved in DNA repair
MPKVFLHVDMDAFFAAVEQHDHPELRCKPVVVGAPADQRGVVAAASYEAREYGIHSAMPSREAGRRCPHAVFVPVNGERYRDVSRQIFGILERFTPLIEPLSIDEAFLDVTGSRRLFGTGPAIARTIKQAVHGETGLTASVGVAPNKFLAKLASDLEKPDGLTIVPTQQAAITSFLAPLPVSRLWGVGKVTQAALETAGIHTIGDLQQTTRERLSRAVGRHATQHLLALAFGRDEREVELAVEQKSISKEHTFGTDCRDVTTLERTLCDLTEEVGARLRAGGRYAGKGHLKLRWKDFGTITRQKPLAPPCCDDFSLREAALGLFRAEKLKQPVRLIGFGVSDLRPRDMGQQLELFQAEGTSRARREELSRAVDDLRQRFGRGRIQRGSIEPDGD